MDTITDAPAIAIAAGMATVIPVCMRSTASGSIVIFVTASDSSLTISSPFGSVPFALALFTTVPASISESDSLYVAVASIDSPGARTIPLSPDTPSLQLLSSPSDASSSPSISVSLSSTVSPAFLSSPAVVFSVPSSLSVVPFPSVVSSPSVSVSAASLPSVFSNENQMNHQQILIMTTTLIHNRHEKSSQK